MYEIGAICRRFEIPILGALCIVSAKKLADRRLPSLEDASELAWCLLMMSIGAMMVSSRGWTAPQYQAKFVADVALALLLIVNRRRKILGHNKLVSSRSSTHLACVAVSCGELLVGLTAVLLTST